MAWWLEGATSTHFGWVRNPQEVFVFEIFGAKEQKGKNREKSEKRNFGGDILSISTDNRNFANISAEISKVLFLDPTNASSSIAVLSRDETHTLKKR